MSETNRPRNGKDSPSPASVLEQRRRGPFFAMRRLLRTRIVAGLLMVIPIWVTWVAVRFLYDLMTWATRPMAEKVAEILIEGNKERVPEVVARYMGYVDWVVPALAVLLTLFILYLLGLLTANVFGRRLIGLMELLVARLPLVKTVYRSTKQVVMTLGGSTAMSFQRVVLVEFPRPGMKCIGFLTAVMKDVDTGREMASIFIATTPNPTTGYMQIVPLDEVSETNWTVEEAIKLLMSGGVLSPPTVPFDKIHPVHWPGTRPAARSAAACTTDEQPAPEEKVPAGERGS